MIVVDISGLDYREGLDTLISHIHNREKINIHIDFWADHRESKIIRDFVWIIFDTFEIDNPWKWRFILITDELINNAIEHWSLPWETDSCVINAAEDEKWEFSIVIEVHDTGNGKDAKDATRMSEIKEMKKSQNNDIYMGKRWRWLFHITEKIVDRLSFSESPRWWLAVKIEKNITPILSNWMGDIK